MRTIETIYGPVFIAILFIVGVNLDQAQEVIYGSFADFRTRYDILLSVALWSPEWNDAFLGALFIFAVACVRVFVLAFVPVAVILASRWAISAHRLTPSGNAAKLPEMFGALTLLAYIVAMGRGLEIVDQCFGALRGDCWLSIVLFALTTIFYLAFFLIHMTLGVWHRQLKAPNPQKHTRVSILFALALIAFSLSFALWPHWSFVLGPVATAGGMFAVWAYALAALTVLSAKRKAFGIVPWILVLGFFAVISSSEAAALLPVLVIFACLVGLAFADGVFALGRHLGTMLGSLASPFSKNARALGKVWASIKGVRFGLFGKVSIAVTIASLLALGLHSWYDDCRSLSGCNITRSIPLEQGRDHVDRPADAQSAYLEWISETEAPTARIIAARGGGIYAAYHAGYYLAVLADLDEEHANSIFAVSGISGGSIGAGVYWAVRSSGLCHLGQYEASGSLDQGAVDDLEAPQNTCHREAIRDILGHDYLSPILATLFTRDLFDSVLPVSILAPRPIDRGRVFENELIRNFESWARARCRALGTDAGTPLPIAAQTELVADCIADGESDLLPLGLLQGTVAQTWTPAGETASRAPGAPLLLLGTVNVSSGELRIISPLQTLNGKPAHFHVENEEGGHHGDLRLVSAMVSSARFPIVTPPMRVREFELHEQGDTSNATLENLQFTDGGFYDNSGLEAIWDILLELQEHANGLVDSPVGAIEVVFMHHEPALDAETDPAIEPSPRGAFGTPVAAFLSSWTEGLEGSRQRFNELFCADGNAPAMESRFDVFQEDAEVMISEGIAENFTLSWFLSEHSRNNIEQDTEAEALRHLNLDRSAADGC